MKIKPVFQTNELGYFIGITEAYESPLEPDVFLIPAGAFEDEPPYRNEPGVTCWRRVDGAWKLEDIPKPPESPPPEKPKVCSPAQGLVALFAIKRITEDDVLAAIAHIPDEVQRYTVKIGYQRATTWERGSPAMQTMAQLLQLSESDLDELFVYAVGVAV